MDFQNFKKHIILDIDRLGEFFVENDLFDKEHLTFEQFVEEVKEGRKEVDLSLN